MYKKILVPVDGSEASKRALAEAVKLAQSQGAVLRLVHVVNPHIAVSAFDAVYDYEQLIDSFRKSGAKILEEAEASARTDGLEVQTSMVESIAGAAADGILEEAARWPADLIVMGTHGRRGVRRLVMGSDAEQVLRSAPVPVLLVREPGG
ncbi:MAG: universal stress protein [Proteobacteria bacterium]|nr:MAG: universal stress protein [Pseudomonadota bacterium]